MKKTSRILILLVTMIGFTYPQILHTYAYTAVRHQARNSRTPHLNLINSPADAMDEDWVIECVDCPKLFDSLTDRSMQLDSKGHPHIAYGGDKQYYAWFDGIDWHYEVVDEGPGGNAVLRMDSNDIPHLVYGPRSWGDDCFKYATKIDNTWQTETVVCDYYNVPTMDLDQDGHPHVSYLDGRITENTLMYAYQNDSGWHHEIVENDVSSSRLAIEIDMQGRPHIGYSYTYSSPGETTRYLKYTYKDSEVWHSEIVEEGQDWYSCISMAMSEAGTPHISYTIYDSDLERFLVKYANRYTGEWQLKTLAYNNYEIASSIQVDSEGYPHIIHNVNGLNYVYQNESGWQIETVNASVDQQPSFVLYEDQSLHISYWEPAPVGHKLFYTYRDGANWQTITVDEGSRAGKANSLAVDMDGYPHISYTNEAQELIYAHKDSTGWQFEIVDDYTEDNFTALALDEHGYPHIIYHRFSDALTYAKFGETGWVFESVESESSQCFYIPEHISMLLDKNGFPHMSSISGNDSSDDEPPSLIYTFRDAQGWHCEVVDMEGGGSPSLVLDREGFPHISYNQDFISCGKGGCLRCFASLKYAKKTLNGWQVQVVDSERYTGKNSSITLDSNDSPHISYINYIDEGFDILMYAFQTNDSWVIEAVDVQNARYPSIFLDWEDIPHIYYWGNYLWDSDFKHAYKSAAGWQTTTSFSKDVDSSDSSLSVDQIGYPHISYYAWGQGDLEYFHIPAPDYDINTSPEDMRLYGRMGETVTTSLKIRNAGRETDGYNLTVDGNRWPVISQSVVDPLAGGDYTSINIQVSIPTTVTLGESDTASMKITSQTDVRINTTITLTSYAASFTYLPLVER